MAKVSRDLVRDRDKPNFLQNYLIETVNLSIVKPNPNNPRVIKDDKFKKLVDSIKKFPEMLEIRPVVINKDNVVLGGNMRIKACKEVGLKKIPIIRAENLTEDQQKEFIIKDNVGFGEWEWEMLANEWDVNELDQWGLDIPDFNIEEPDIEEDNYEEPDNIKIDVVLGDIIEIGEHRLLCGDSREGDNIKKLLNNKEPYLMVTDPPYGVVYDPNWRNEADRANGKKIGARATGVVENDDNADWTETWALAPCKVAYVYHAGKFSGIVQQSLEVNDFEIRSQIIWVKSNFAISRGDYHWKHEPCWYAVKKGSKGNWSSDRKQTTIWEIDKPQKSETGHGTQKPVECMAKPIGNHDGDVYDPFLGSGTTMVASHQLSRKCFGIELNPKYCQIIIDRMKKLDDSLEVKINGEVYNG